MCALGNVLTGVCVCVCVCLALCAKNMVLTLLCVCVCCEGSYLCFAPEVIGSEVSIL